MSFSNIQLLPGHAQIKVLTSGIVRKKPSKPYLLKKEMSNNNSTLNVPGRQRFIIKHLKTAEPGHILVAQDAIKINPTKTLTLTYNKTEKSNL